MILGESYTFRSAKVVATLLCAFGLGHIMQNDSHDPSHEPEMHDHYSKIKNFVHTTFSSHEHAHDTETYALMSVVQTAGEKNQAADRQERLSPYAQVIHTRDISSDMPIIEFPSEVPSPQFDLMALSM
ncbi:hypothetical protein ROA7450_01325 [Roseovarius albus]|uniref:Uncharacterized protein n=2 Tax=Roseovarius albus TaxID=1247867 RepID=A0A1X6YSZ6_9RHOB|nr:hypothetical protein ROA7450_01325 [Roseovarius albus]